MELSLIPEMTPQTRYTILFDVNSEGRTHSFVQLLEELNDDIEPVLAGGALSEFALSVAKDPEHPARAELGNNAYIVISSAQWDIENLYIVGGLKLQIVAANFLFVTQHPQILSSQMLFDFVYPMEKLDELASNIAERAVLS